MCNNFSLYLRDTDMPISTYKAVISTGMSLSKYGERGEDDFNNKHGAGVFLYYEDGSNYLIKSPDYFSSIRESFEKHLHDIPPILTLGHTRRSSYYKDFCVERSHPFQIDDVVYAHNGLIRLSENGRIIAKSSKNYIPNDTWESFYNLMNLKRDGSLSLDNPASIEYWINTYFEQGSTFVIQIANKEGFYGLIRGDAIKNMFVLIWSKGYVFATSKETLECVKRIISANDIEIKEVPTYSYSWIEQGEFKTVSLNIALKYNNKKSKGFWSFFRK